MSALPSSSNLPRLRAVVGQSSRLRDELLAPLLAAWTGPVKRVINPDRPMDLLADLETPSLFGDAASALVIVRVDAEWLRKHAAALEPAASAVATCGALVLVTEALDGRSALAKALAKTHGVQIAGIPEGGESAWVVDRLRTLTAAGIREERAIAQALIDIYGTDADALLGAMDLLTIYHGDEAVTMDGLRELFNGIAERPVWEVTGAILDGQPRRALDLIQAGRLAPEQVLATLASEVRRLLACCATKDDGEAARLAGLKGKPNLFHARRRAAALGAGPLQRLLHGIIQTARQLRTTGVDADLAIEMLVLHAQRVIRSS